MRQLLRKAKPVVAGTLLVAGILAASPAAGLDETAYAAANAGAVSEHIRPAYASLAEATATLNGVSSAVCAASTPDRLPALRAAYNRAMDAFMGVQHLRFGPGELLLRNQRFHYWPDRRNTTARQLGALIKARDLSALQRERIARSSVAVQGLSAMERLLFGGAEEALFANTDEARYRCSLVAAIARNLDDIAGELVRGWDAGPSGFSDRFLNPSADDPYFRNHGEASLDLLKSLHGGLQLIAEVKLQRPLGRSAERGGAAVKPRLAESWRSRRSLRNVRLNLHALRALYRTVFAPAMETAEPDLDREIRAAFDAVLAQADANGSSIQAVLEAEDGLDKLLRLRRDVSALTTLVTGRLAPALGLQVGFNALDGD